MDSSYNALSTKPIYHGTQIVWYILGVIETLLAFRFVLKIMGANPAASFTDLIYTITSFLTAPFAAVFSRSAIQDSVFEWTTLLAMLVYWIVAMGIIRIFLMNKSVSTREAAAKLESDEDSM